MLHLQYVVDAVAVVVTWATVSIHTRIWRFLMDKATQTHGGRGSTWCNMLSYQRICCFLLMQVLQLEPLFSPVGAILLTISIANSAMVLNQNHPTSITYNSTCFQCTETSDNWIFVRITRSLSCPLPLGEVAVMCGNIGWTNLEGSRVHTTTKQLGRV